jgi:EAL domain-containing protein (putative c-di-GMP-specific phosphodiesterase class I)/GGDEF domain-containing protein
MASKKPAGSAAPAHGGAPPASSPLRESRFERLFEQLQTLIQENQAQNDPIGRVDHVTRLPNRVQFLDDFTGAAAFGAAPRTLILVTLADAKHFNELLRALGHAYSEDFVRAGAWRLRVLLGQETKLYHVSVLSFAFFTTDAAEGTPPPVVHEIVKAFRESIVCHDIPVDTRVGVGVTPLSNISVSPSELLRATLAAAQDSRRGYEGWAWYNRKNDEAHMRAFRILTDLPAAFASHDQLSLHFQPRVSLRDGACTSAEALIRWTHPGMGAIPPGEFVTLAETTALITPLTRWVMEHAVRAVADWQELRKGLRVSVNISPKNLEEPHFVDAALDLTRRYGVDPLLVELEFTEGTLASNPGLMLNQLGRLRQSGFEIALDDFGSGYSNMSYLGRIPAQHLKIDQSFIRPLESETKNQLLVRSIIDLAHALDYSVVAEGIETQGAYGLLAAWGCDEGQGYLMSRPLTRERFAEWLDAPRTF